MAKETQKTQKRNSNKKSFRDTIKYLEKGQWNSLKEVIDNTRDRLLIKLLYSSGCRVNEFSLMKIKDVEFEEGYIHIPAENTKTKESRTVRIGKELLNEMKGWLKDNKKAGDDYLFDSRQSERMTPRRIQQIVKKYAAIAKIECHPHTLRHTHIVHALQEGVPINAVQAQVGHKRLTTTEIYSKLAPKQVKEAYDKAKFE